MQFHSPVKSTSFELEYFDEVVPHFRMHQSVIAFTALVPITKLQLSDNNLAIESVSSNTDLSDCMMNKL